MKYLIIIFIFANFLYATPVRNDTKQVVIDKDNNLMWEDTKKNKKILLSHQNSQKYCDELKYLGYTNWRLPEIVEYQSIVDKQNYKNYIHKAFKHNKKDGYWASKVHFRTLWFYADYMYFISGTPYYDSRFKKKYVRCLRNIK